jgi:ankyrin repeat protein
VVGKQPKRKPRPGVDEYGRTDLHYAAVDADVARVRSLIADGANAGAADDGGWTPLHFAVQSQAFEICELLLRAGSAVDAVDSYGNTPLWRAVFDWQGHSEIILLLRQYGADPNRANASGISPLNLAATMANPTVAQLLTEKPVPHPDQRQN